MRQRLLTIALLAMSACYVDRTPVDPDADRESVRNRWYVAQQGPVQSCPLPVEDVVVFATTDRLVARDRQDGSVRWSAEAWGVGHASGSPILVGDVIVATGGEHTHGVNAETGRIRWRYPTPDTPRWPAGPGSVSWSRIASDAAGMVYIPARNGTVSALDAATGDVRWVWHTDDSWEWSSGALGADVSGDTVYVTVRQCLVDNCVQDAGWLFLLDARSGVELTRLSLPFVQRLGGTAMVWNDLVIVPEGAGRMIAYDRFTREPVWDHRPPAEYAGSAAPAVHGGTLYLDGSDHWLYAVDAATGAVEWRTEYGGSPFVPPRASERRVYAPFGQSLRIYDRATGVLVRETLQGHGVYGVNSWFGCATAVGREVYVTVSGAAWSFEEP
jgi:outer membrane protein assembly factor BamB